MMIPAAVLAAYGFEGTEVEVLSGGLINQSFCVRGGEGQALAAVQRLHPIFGAELHHDIVAITQHLRAKGMATPELLRTEDNALWVEHEGKVWRAMSWIDGHCVQRIDSPERARAGAELVARFHRAVVDLEHDFHFSRAGVHDTEQHLAKLAARSAPEGASWGAEAEALQTQILGAAQDLPPLDLAVTRICHGDLKISNLLFDREGRGLCLIDLDTLGRQPMAHELGDALRSWANPSGEDLAEPCIDARIVAAAARGYAEGAGDLLSRSELESIIPGLETICVELAARFCVDVFDDSYFGWDEERFESRRAHNLVRARGQLALGLSVASKREELMAAWLEPFVTP